MFTKGQDFDYIVVGAGLAGLVVAERIANVLNKRVLVIDERDHIGGNCYDFKDKNGIIIHKYGPHLFRTNDSEVFNYLSRFTDWDIYFHRVRVYIDGKVVPLPINFKSIEELFPQTFAQNVESKLLSKYGLNKRVPILELLKEQDSDLKNLARFIYDKVYYPYSKKQWGLEPEEIDPEMLCRVPIVVGYDDRYFFERYQAVPVSGYSNIFKHMLKSKNIFLRLNLHSSRIIEVSPEEKKIFFMKREYRGSLIFTGTLDELFRFRFGKLKYRSLQFRFRTYNTPFYQEAAVINYPENFDFTRITEFKHIHKIDSEKTTIAIEYPVDHLDGRIPYYPVPTREEIEKHRKYYDLASSIPNLYVLGRLAEFYNYSMGALVRKALDLFEKIRNE